MLQSVLLSIPNGILLGGAYGAIALGLSVIFGVTRMVNFAHGATLMVASFAYLEIYNRFGINPYLAIVIVVPIMYAFGFFLQKFLVKPLLMRERADVISPTSVMLMTIGLDYALSNLYMMIYGSTTRTITTPASSTNLTIKSDSTILFVTPYSRIIACVASFVLAGTLWYIINKTELGKRIRSVAQNRDAAALCGVDVYKTYSIAFGLGIATVAVAASCLVQFYFVNPNLGGIFGTKSSLIVVLGGLGSIPGALLGGMIFGLVETVGALFINTTSASMVSFLLFILVLVFKPNGLMGRK